MRIYFTCSARGLDEYGKNYELIFQTIKDLGHSHIDDYHVDANPTKVYSGSDEVKEKLYQEAMDHIKRCDVMVLEVSKHSLTMGYLMRQALDIGKPVIALHVAGRAPVFALGINDDKLQLIEYKEDMLKEELKEALDFASGKIDTRFNFFISPKHQNYLDWVSKKKRIPRAVYLRRLIEEDMKKNKDYEE